ncbi:hypothetical protein SAMN06295879_0208 [Agreia bicolorata]|uniref:Signal transduction histidine kinase n=1 Tax=Agreia bicolorata TaxID=110935 RepID=A0A1T4WT63_9MICO|nr:hypothetical protein [Agreia bicolorata]SKA80514.1 hypothetical protein SAMN06295879_0208 [Agreia bicolorata]
MKGLAAAVGTALRSGRFVSTWSVVFSFVLSFTVMAPSIDSDDVVPAVAAIAACWACFALGLVITGVIERAAGRSGVRVVVVVVGLLVLSACRPMLQDAWLQFFGASVSPIWQLPFRILTNLIVWSVSLGATAVLVVTSRSVSATNSTLRAVLFELDAASGRAAQFAERAHDTVAGIVVRLRSHVELLRVNPGDADSNARAVAEQIRSLSHHVADVATSDLRSIPVTCDSMVASPRANTTPLLRVPPAGVVAMLYLACMFPYAVRTASLPTILAACVIVIVGGRLVDVCSRRRRRSRRAPMPTAVYLSLSLLVGIGLSVVSAIPGASPATAMVPTAAYAALAGGAAAASGRLHALRVERQRLSRAIEAEQRASRAATTATRDALRAASEILHRDGQAACAVFALRHPHPTPVVVTELADVLDELIDRVAVIFEYEYPSVDTRSIENLVETWARVTPIRMAVSLSARAALDTHPLSARTAYEVVAEGLLNGAKHGDGGATVVTCDVTRTGAGPRLSVTIQTSGRLAPGAQLRPTSHIGHLGARLDPEADGATLEALIDLDDAIPAPVVVSPERLGEDGRTRP